MTSACHAPVTQKITSSNLVRTAIYGSIAQSVEQRTENPCVAGSIPAGATIFNNPKSFDFGRLAQLVRAPALQAGGHRFESYIAHHVPT